MQHRGHLQGACSLLQLLAGVQGNCVGAWALVAGGRHVKAVSSVAGAAELGPPEVVLPPPEGRPEARAHPEGHVLLVPHHAYLPDHALHQQAAASEMQLGGSPAAYRATGGPQMVWLVQMQVMLQQLPEVWGGCEGGRLPATGQHQLETAESLLCQCSCLSMNPDQNKMKTASPTQQVQHMCA